MKRIFTHLHKSHKARVILEYVETHPGKNATQIDEELGTNGAIDYLNTLWLDNRLVFRIKNTSTFHPQGIKYWSAP